MNVNKNIGEKFGKLTVTKFSHVNKNKTAYFYELQCECGNHVIKNLSEVRRHSKKHKTPVHCGCLKVKGKYKRNAPIQVQCLICRKKFLRKASHAKRSNRYIFCSNDCRFHAVKTIPECNANWKNRNELERFFAAKYQRMVQSAKKRKIPFGLIWEDLYTLYKKQNGLCYYTGISLSFDVNNPFLLSVDRVNNNEGYYLDNIVLCSYCINALKNDFTIDQLEELLNHLNTKKKMAVSFKKLSNEAIVPKYSSEGANGLDLYAVSKEKVYDTGGSLLYISYKTDIAIEIPEGYCGQILPRSSISKTTLTLSNSTGLIDSDFRGNLELRFRNHYPYNNEYNIGDKIGQLLILPIPKIELVEVEELSSSERDLGGFGSTGV